MSTVIVNWNSGQRLSILLASLAALKDDLEEILVIDNASEDASHLETGNYDFVELIRLRENRGFGGAANLGISRCLGRWVLLLNPDIRIDSESLCGLFQAADHLPDCGLLTGRLVSEEGKSQEKFHVRSLPTMRSVLKDALFIDELARILSWSPPQKTFASEEAHEVEQPAAACWLLNKEAWAQLGGFDERFYPAWFEDVDFCKRLLDEGEWRIYYLPRFQIFHQGGASLEKLGYRSFLKIFYRNLLKYWKKHHRRSYLPVWVAVRLGLAVRLIHAQVLR